MSVVVRTATTLTFEKNAEYTPISANTFSVNVAGKVIGAVVVAYLTPTAANPIAALTAAEFQVRGAYVAGKNLEYVFKVGANGKIQLSINPLD